MSDEEGPAGAAPHHHMSDEEAIASTVKMALVDSPYVDKETAAWVRKGGWSREQITTGAWMDNAETREIVGNSGDQGLRRQRHVFDRESAQAEQRVERPTQGNGSDHEVRQETYERGRTFLLLHLLLPFRTVWGRCRHATTL